MTRDITNPNSLHLANPKMVIISCENGADPTDPFASSDDARYDLPPTCMSIPSL